MIYEEKKAFIFTSLSQHQVARLTYNGYSRCRKSFSYHLLDDLGHSQEICKTFFLTTLGYHPKNDRLIQSVIDNSFPLSLTTPETAMEDTPQPVTWNWPQFTINLDVSCCNGIQGVCCKPPLFENNRPESHKEQQHQLHQAERGAVSLHKLHVKAKHQAADYDLTADCSTCKKWNDHKLQEGASLQKQGDNLSIHSVEEVTPALNTLPQLARRQDQWKRVCVWSGMRG